MGIIESLNKKFSSAKYDADSDITSVEGIYRVTFYYAGTDSVFDYMYVKARRTESGVATEPARI